MNQPSPAQKVNSLAKYLYKHIDGAHKMSFSPNSADVYMFMYYQAEGGELQQMDFDISLTTYQNKVRVNVTEITEYEKTIGQNIYKPEKLEDMNSAFELIYQNVVNHIKRAYADYDFVF